MIFHLHFQLALLFPHAVLSVIVRLLRYFQLGHGLCFQLSDVVLLFVEQMFDFLLVDLVEKDYHWHRLVRLVHSL